MLVLVGKGATVVAQEMQSTDQATTSSALTGFTD